MIALLNTRNLPFYHEDDEDPFQLSNGILLRVTWQYLITETVQHHLDGIEIPTVLEQFTNRYIYSFDQVQVVYGVVNEWEHQYTRHDQKHTLLGHRSYLTGQTTRNGKPFTEPEIGILLGFSPDPTRIPPFIHTINVEYVDGLLQEAERIAQNGQQEVVGWMSPPFDLPYHASRHVFETVLMARREVGINPTRGRVNAIRRVMDATGVIYSEGGWQLTPIELTRRQEYVDNSMRP